MNGKAILNSLQKSGRGRRKESKAVDIVTRATQRMSCSKQVSGGISPGGSGAGN
jgi:hypothetical protein